MMVTVSRCWWQNHYFDDKFNVKNSHQHNISSTYVTGDIDIDVLKLVS